MQVKKKYKTFYTFRSPIDVDNRNLVVVTLRKVPDILYLSIAPRNINSVDKVVLYKWVVHCIYWLPTMTCCYNEYIKIYTNYINHDIAS